MDDVSAVLSEPISAADERHHLCAQALRVQAGAFDEDDADPAALCRSLAEHGLFIDALPERFGGRALATSATAPLLRALMAIGAANLSAGRIFEGHVNAIKLVFRFGAPAQHEALAQDVLSGAVCGVWNAEAPPGLQISRQPTTGAPARLTGGKIYASGLGLVTRPLTTAKTPDGEMLMLAPAFSEPPPGDVSAWRVRGMRATATGTVDFTDLEVTVDDVVGQPGDYYLSPGFKGGAWRFAAVQAGAAVELARLMREELHRRGRSSDPHQKARIATAALAAETCELWVARAAALAEDPTTDSAAIDAYVNLARLAVERACLEAIALAERGLGLGAFTRPSPVDRVARDLATYLRQPFPDGALEDAASYLVLVGAPPWSAVPPP